MSDLIKPSRRHFLTGLGAFFVAAPAIVRATSIMPVRALKQEDMFALLHARMNECYEITNRNLLRSLYGGGTFDIPAVCAAAGEAAYPFVERVVPIFLLPLDNPKRSD